MAEPEPSRPSFTGVRRIRKTKRSVFVANAVAGTVITIGGIATILAVLAVAVFLVWVVAPLFTPASVEGFNAVSQTEQPELLHAAVDEYRLLGWVLSREGEVEVFRLDNGARRHGLQLVEPGRLVSASFLLQSDLAMLGLEDGTVRFAEIGFASEILDRSALPQGLAERLDELPPETAVDYLDGIVERTPREQYRVQRLRAELGAEQRLGTGPVHLITHVPGPGGPIIAAVAAQEQGLGLWIIVGQEKSDFLTGRSTLVFDQAVRVPFDDLGTLPSHVVLAGTGKDVYLAWSSGELQRIDIANLDAPYVAEKGRLVPRGTALTALSSTLGNNTLVWGDSTGAVGAGFLVRLEELENPEATGLLEAVRHPQATAAFTRTKRLGTAEGSPVRSFAPSARSRLVLAGFEDGEIRLFNVTNAAQLTEIAVGEKRPVLHLAMAPKEDGLLAVTPRSLHFGRLDPKYPEASLRAIFTPVWYEGYPRPEHTWQSSSGTDDFEIKLGLMPLIFGTIKATVYSMLFGAPLAILAAIFTSEFLQGRVRAVIKPSIEFMASLPSVVLGFLAALVFAPFIEEVVPATLATFLALPLVFLLGAAGWQLLPTHWAVRLETRRFFFILAMVPVGLLLGAVLGDPLERWFFGGDLKGWLAWEGAPGEASPFADATGGWLLLCLPISGLVVAFLSTHLLNPLMRQMSAQWDRRKFALVDGAKLALGLAATLMLAWVLSALLSALGFDPRGSYVDTFVQRNALIVGFVMGFAIIPIIYTISEDALSSVPEHLRSASLGAGATPWQTAWRIVLPTAMSGLFSAMMIGLGRAVGETMIVLMAAGNTPVMEWNVFNGFRTLSANIAVELPEAVRNSTHYRTLFLAALALFVMTFVVNTIAEIIRLRFRKRAYQL